MAKYLHNKTNAAREYSGLEIAANDVLLIPPGMYSEFATNTSVAADIEAGHLTASYDGVTELQGIESAKQLVRTTAFRSCIAVDLDNTDQSLSGTSPIVAEASRVLWDFNEDYDTVNHNFVVPVSGVYSFDVQMRFNNFFNVKSVELAIYKRGSPDDYWFILDKKDVNDDTYLQLSNSTLFDFYEGDEYCLKVILEKSNVLLGVTAEIEGNDDYTAWGYNLLRII